MKFTFLGTASGLPCKDRMSSSILFEHNDSYILIDAGEGTAQQLTRLDIDIDKITAIFISHTHPDHFSGLFTLLQMFHLKKRDSHFTVYLPNEAMKAFKMFLDVTFLWKEVLSYRFSIRALRHGQPIETNGFEIMPFPTSHLERYAYDAEKHDMEDLDSFSFAVISGGKRVLYSGDIGSLQDLFNSLSYENTDVLIIEGVHYKLSSLPDFLNSFSVGKTYLTHFAPLPDDFEAIEGIVLANDLMTVEV
jgi:ribonuclease BN (tRNA processing enzyme)